MRALGPTGARGSITDGDEYEVIPDDTEADIEGEHPDGDYPAEVYNDDEFEDGIDESDVAVPEEEA